jgi:co-chaperonin GroES (HSP10)
MRATLREIAVQADPKKALLGALGDMSDWEIFHNLVMVATYIEPEKTPGGIIKPDNTLLENRFQGKVGLVIKLGPLAFKDDNIAKFGGVDVEVGDWVFYSASDGFELYSVEHQKSTGTCCRLFEDTRIKGRVADPSLVY